MIQAAFSPEAVLGATFGLSIQRICSIGLIRTINASEAGLGTAAVIYGSTGSSNGSTYGLGGFGGGGRSGGYGNFVKLGHAAGIASGYGHMSRIAVSRGQHVRQGQVIGAVIVQMDISALVAAGQAIAASAK